MNMKTISAFIYSLQGISIILGAAGVQDPISPKPVEELIKQNEVLIQGEKELLKTVMYHIYLPRFESRNDTLQILFKEMDELKSEGLWTHFKDFALIEKEEFKKRLTELYAEEGGVFSEENEKFVAVTKVLRAMRTMLYNKEMENHRLNQK